MLSDYGQVFIFLIFALGFVAIALVSAKIVSPKRPTKGKYTTYECGEDTVGETWIKFNIRFYITALIFIIFDVEIVFLFPWAVQLKQLGASALVSILVFVFIIAIGYIYAWKKKALEWN